MAEFAMAGPIWPLAFELDVQKRDGHRQLGRREQLLADSRQDVLRRQPVNQSLAERMEEIRLLDILLALEHRHRKTPRAVRQPPSAVPQTTAEDGCPTEAWLRSRGKQVADRRMHLAVQPAGKCLVHDRAVVPSGDDLDHGVALQLGQ